MAVAPSPPTPAAPAPPRPDTGFRPDVDALRAVAIVLVVLYHAHVPGFAGGFVGVDVFFAISGFLITRNLLIERDRHERIGLRSFWLRRLRRLVPAMAVMVTATVAASLLILTPLEWGAVGAQGLAATLYVSNLHFAGLADDYFGGGVATAPLLHTWSLAVEEQFYLVWPLLVAGVLRAAASRRARTATLAVTLTVVTVASAAHSIHLVRSGSSLAFYGLPARTWEFSAAGVLALLAVRRPRWRLANLGAIAMAAAGLAAIGLATTTYGPETAFPGAAAVLPVGGTLAVIAAGTWSAATWRAAVAPLRWLGRISYSWYLWHWPAMVLAAAALDADTPAVRVTAGLGALALAQLSLAWVEDPVRTSPRLARSASATLAVTGAFTVLALVAVAASGAYHDHVGRDRFHADLASAADKAYLDGCTWTDVDGVEVCEVGDLDGERTIVLSGDSHAMSWVPGFDAAARGLDLRVLVRAASSCPGAPISTISERTGEVNASCDEYRADTLSVVDHERPAAVVLVSSDFTRRAADEAGRRIVGRDAQLGAWSEALRRLDAELAEDGIELGAVLDNPRVSPDPLRCMEAERDVEACDADRADALRRVARHVENERRALGEAATFDTVELICDASTCDIWRDGAYVWADETHLSDDFTRRQADHVATYLERLLAAE